MSYSTLLKCLDANSKEQNIARTMDLISSLDEPMDEVLLLCTDFGCSALLPKCHPSLKLMFEKEDLLVTAMLEPFLSLFELYLTC